MMSKIGLYFAVLLFLASSAGATVYTWISTSDVDWMNPSNWDPTGVPQATGDRASINNGHLAELSGTNAVTLDRIYVFEDVGSTVRVKDNASITMTYASGCDIYLGHNFGMGTGYGRLEIQDNASVTGGIAKIWQAAGAGSTAEIDVSGGTLETFYWDLGGGADSNATVNHSGGDINLLYRTWVGSTAEANETNPEIIRWNISGGRMRYTGVSGSSSVFSVGNGTGDTPCQDIVITQTGGDVDFGDMVHFNLGDMGNNNTVKWSISGGSLNHNYLFRNGRDDQGTSWGYATATFEVIGAGPSINFGSYKSAQKSTLKCVIDSSGLATINVSGTAIIGVDSTLDIDMKDGYIPCAGQTYTVLTADGGIMDYGLVLASEDTTDWSFNVTSNNLTIEFIRQPDSDLNDDCNYNLIDFAYIALYWLEDTYPAGDPGFCGDINHPFPLGDINWDCVVDSNDIYVLAQDWLTPAITAIRVDSLERIYPDIDANIVTYTAPISVPRGGSVPFQYSVKACKEGLCNVNVIPPRRSDNTPLDGQIKIYYIAPVHVEGNSDGHYTSPYPSDINYPEFLPYFVRTPFFDVAEALFEVNEVTVSPSNNTGILVDVKVPADAQTGIYTGCLRLQMDADIVNVPFSLEVHKAVVTDYSLNSTYRLSFLPEDLVYGVTILPAWWSEDYWDLAEAAGRTFKEAGLNIILTPLVSGFKGNMPQNPLIPTRINMSGDYVFDFNNFERWGELFIEELGFEKMEGWQIGRREAYVPYDVYAYDERISQTVKIFTYQDTTKLNDFFDYVGEFFSAFYSVLVSNDWASNYIQELADEPHTEHLETYTTYKQLLTDNMPGIPNLDAINYADPFSDVMDIQVISLHALETREYLVNQRRAAGLSTWFYTTALPYPPRPNTWLDRSLSCSRLYPWLAYLVHDVEGYLFWAPNRYRGADPYATSIGPTVSGSQDPGDPVGAMWTFYPTPNGLVLSMRMVAYREGLLDYTLLKILAQYNQTLADTIMDSIATSTTNYEENPEAYHQARRNLLVALDGYL